MNNIEDIVSEINADIEKLERYIKYAKEEDVRENLKWELDQLRARREIWLSFLS